MSLDDKLKELDEKHETEDRRKDLRDQLAIGSVYAVVQFSNHPLSSEETATRAYKMADAMLAERDKEAK